MLYADEINQIAPRVSEITKNMERILSMLKPAQVVPVGTALSLMLEYFTRLVYQSKLDKITVVDASLTAWLSRNILELEIWISYALKSEANATRLRNDFVLDVQGLQKRFSVLFTKQSIQDAIRELQPIIDNAKQVLKLPNVRYLTIGEAADVGLKEIFDTLNPIMSKLVHPTSLSMFADAKTTEAWHTMLLGIAIILLKLTLGVIEALPMTPVA